MGSNLKCIFFQLNNFILLRLLRWILNKFSSCCKITIYILFNLIVGSSLSAGLVVSELLPTTPIRFEEPKKDYTKVRNTECVELVFPSPSKYTTTDISDIIDMPSPITPKRKQNYNMNNDTPRKKKLKQKIFTQQHQMQNKKKQISKLKNRINNLKNRNHLNNLISSHKFRSNHSRAIVTMQLRNKRRQWTIEEKNLALTMFYKSPATYNFLRLQNLNLPGPSTVRGWIGKSKFLPGFNKIFMTHLKKKIEFKEYKEKACSIFFDEISIKEFLEYSKDFDFIEGYEDLGRFGRTCNTANSCLVFMARGIYSPWKIPITYFLAHSAIKHAVLKNLIIDVLQELFDIGILPKVIICDQGSNNQSALKSLNVTENKPYFYVNENKIISLFDTPHLLKSVRNNLIGNTFKKK